MIRWRVVLITVIRIIAALAAAVAGFYGTFVAGALIVSWLADSGDSNDRDGEVAAALYLPPAVLALLVGAGLAIVTMRASRGRRADHS